MRSSAAGGVNLQASGRKNVPVSFFKSAEGSLVVTSSRTNVISKQPKSSRRQNKLTSSQPSTAKNNAASF